MYEGRKNMRIRPEIFGCFLTDQLFRLVEMQIINKQRSTGFFGGFFLCEL